ncbi:right-handed parallel beta-helix repeat-containing protein [Psychroserpens algicola]|uniref:Right-handed parallel beta-helix repeat-containing protein n=1 Tax=Psychroserpens algicola TaxID=1719034 RepID=A0ABT0HBQ8_9FLAO|nr:right-handed parallel beta-helix repeat-containing protein [Psychroserpens algicola]MCK8481786.1 right-handed parallel beta-helix repeat-containing protein [Psychroserpens algicola]
MTKTLNKDKKSVIVIFGVILLLLLISIVLSIYPQKNTDIGELNPYTQVMPLHYSSVLKRGDFDKGDSKKTTNMFSAGIVDNEFERYLLIFNEFPSKSEIANDFTVNIYSKDLQSYEDSKLSFNLTSNAVKYNFKNKMYGVFKMNLPLIDIDKIDILQVPLNKRLEPWKKTILNPIKKKINAPEKAVQSDFNGGKTTPIIFKRLLKEMCKQSEISFLDYDYEISNGELKEVSENLKRFTEGENTLVRIKNPINFWKAINLKDKNVLKFIDINGAFVDNVKQGVTNYLSEESSFSDLFDTHKLSKFYAILNMFSSDCVDQELYFIYNQDNSTLEPLFNYSSCLNSESKYLSKSNIDNTVFLEKYAQAIAYYASVDLYNTYINNNKELLDELKLINKYNPKDIFDFSKVRIYQRKLEKSINPSIAIKAELIDANKEVITLSIRNVSYYPIQIMGLNHEEKKDVLMIDRPKQILSGQTDTIIFNLPRSFENLFVSKKKKITGFVLHKHIYDIFVSYSLLGLEQNKLASIIPYQEKEYIEKDLFRDKTFINNHKDLVINNKENIISFKKDSVTISAPLVIPKGYVFQVKAGTKIDIVNGGKIVSYSPLKLRGNKEKLIEFYSSDKKGQGILILSEGLESNLTYVEFNNLTHPKHGNWSVTGAVTFYESPVKLEHVSVKNNTCEDALNIVRTSFTMKNCLISGTQSDAFDGDFVKGTISDCKFNNLGNDAIDVSGSDLIIEKVIISNAGDKGLSAGEDSKMQVNDVQISKSEIGIAGKDLSIVKGENLTIIDTKLGFTAFQKKPEFGPSNITVTGVTMNGVEMKYLIESSSTLLVDGEKIETTQNVKDRMYGVEFGRSSAETRNSQ